MRKLIVDLHAWLGAVAALFILALSVTGIAILFSGPLMQAETGAFPSSDSAAVEVDGESLETKLALAQETAGPTFMPLGYLGPNAEIVTDAAMIYGMSDIPENGGEVQIVTFDAATGEVLGALYLDRTWTHELIEFHANLLMGDAGAIWVSIIGVIIALLAAAGIYQWWPLNRSLWTKIKAFRLGGTLPRQSWKLHSLSGFWLSLAIAVWALTGVYWSQPQWTPGLIPETTALPINIAEEWQGKSCDGANSPAQAVEIARRQFPNARLFEAEFAAPWQPYHIIHMSSGSDIDVTDGDIRVWVDAVCADLTHSANVAEGTWAQMAGSASAGFHSGRIFGALRVPLVTLIGLALILLSITGLHQWWRRVTR